MGRRAQKGAGGLRRERLRAVISGVERKKPELQDFGIEPGEYALYKGHHSAESESTNSGCLLTLAIVVLLVLAAWFLFDGEVATAVGVGSFLPALFFWVFVACPFITRLRRSNLLNSPVAYRIKLYDEAIATYTEEEREAERQQREVERRERQTKRARRAAEMARQEAEKAKRRKLINHWLSLGGLELEDEMVALCSRLGYRVETTPLSGDGGVDLILRNNSGKKVVVQCKSYKSPVGPAAARELYGSMMHFGADRAVLVCPAGFTRGAVEFVRGKEIDLVSASKLIDLAASAARGNSHDTRLSDTSQAL